MNFGKIRTIGPTELHLEEIVPDNLGGYMTRQVVLAPGVRYEEPRKAIKRKYHAPILSTRLQTEFIEDAAHPQLSQRLPLRTRVQIRSERSPGLKWWRHPPMRAI
jgi:hypothetical protein